MASTSGTERVSEFTGRIGAVVDLSDEGRQRIVAMLADEHARCEESHGRRSAIAVAFVFAPFLAFIACTAWVYGGDALHRGFLGTCGIFVMAFAVAMLPGFRHLLIVNIWFLAGILAVAAAVGLSGILGRWFVPDIVRYAYAGSIGVAAYVGSAMIALPLALSLERWSRRNPRVHTRAYVVHGFSRALVRVRSTLAPARSVPARRYHSGSHLLPEGRQDVVVDVAVVRGRTWLLATASHVYAVRVAPRRGSTAFDFLALTDRDLSEAVVEKHLGEVDLEDGALALRAGLFWDTLVVGDLRWRVWWRSLFLAPFVRRRLELRQQRLADATPAMWNDAYRLVVAAELRALEQSMSLYFRQCVAAIPPHARGWLDDQARRIVATAQEWQRWVVYPRGDTFRHLEHLLEGCMDAALRGEWNALPTSDQPSQATRRWKVWTQRAVAAAMLLGGGLLLVVDPSRIGVTIEPATRTTIGLAVLWLGLTVVGDAGKSSTGQLDTLEKLKKLITLR